MKLGDESNENFTPPKNADALNAIKLLKPGSDHHKHVLNYLTKRIKTSEDAMSRLYDRWQVAERKMQAYLSLPDYEQQLRDMNDRSKPPAPAIILFPYMFATIATTVTYCMKVYTSHRPFFPLGAASKEAADNVPYMEAAIQYQAEQSRMIQRLFQLLLDGELYGMGALRCTWQIKKGRRRKMRQLTEAERTTYMGGREQMPSLVRDSEDRVIYEGSDVMNIDPFMFFPDPNVPLCEVADKGEYVFWREIMGKHMLLQAQANGELLYVDSVDPGESRNYGVKWRNFSNRNVVSGGDSHAGNERKGAGDINNSYVVDQGTVELIPSELGLGPEDYPVKWLFTILNGKQIVQAEPLDMDHGKHPVGVSEPYSLGYGFGSPALSDYIGPIQDILSWFVDSHIYNVRASLNNQWLYDPSKINADDLKYPQPGKHIRLKALAYGTDVRTVLHQFPVQDVTGNHMNDMSAFIKIGDMVSAVNDIARGQQSAGGRRTATENRMMGENAFGRLGVHASKISQQCLVRIAEQMVLNTQQLQSEEMWLRLIGKEQFQRVGPNLLMGDFTYTVHDGTLPLDRVAGFDLWKEILINMAQSPVLTQTHSLPKIFEHVCTLGGAANISSFRLVPDAEMDNMARAGNAIPLPQAAANVANGAAP